MSLHFNAGQFEKAFDSRRLQNYQLRKGRKKRPSTHEGFTQVIANDRGHLLPSIPRSARSPWGTFVGTWDLPRKIPGPKITDPMARTPENVYRNLSFKGEADVIINGMNKVRRPQCGQPIEAMPECVPSNAPAPSPKPQTPVNASARGERRSGAENPVAQGTPPKMSPKPSTSPVPKSPINSPTNAVGREPIASPVAPVTPMMRNTPLRGLSANGLQSPTNARNAAGTPKLYSGSPKPNSPLPDIHTLRRDMTTPQEQPQYRPASAAVNPPAAE